jgi:hypothetical protein
LLPAGILTPAHFDFSGGEDLAQISLPVSMLIAAIVGMFTADN